MVAQLRAPGSAPGTGAVDSVNGETGDVELDAADIPFTPDGSIAATDVQAAIQEVRDEVSSGGAPTTADYLVGTANGGLSNEIVVGSSPGGELGGSWASPTVDSTHSGSSHAGVQAAAEGTAAAALSAHAAAADPHPGYLTPAEGNAAYDAAGAAATAASGAASALASHEADTTAVHGIANTANLIVEGDARLTNARTPTAHAASHADGGTDEIAIDGSQVTSGTVADARIASTIARDSEVSSAVSSEATARDAAIAAAIAALIASAPGLLDTLDEIAAALGDDPNFATTITTAIATKVAKSLYDANTILKADSDDTPAALTVGEQTIVGRKTGGNIAALTASEVRTLLALVVGTNVQAWDGDLDTLAANITAFGQSLVDDADAAAARSTLGLGTAATQATSAFDAAGAASAAQAASQPLDTDLTAIAALATTSYGRAFLEFANAGAALTALGVDADLATFAVPASTTISTFGASLVDDAAASNARTTLGLGTAATSAATDFQPIDADLTTIAGLTATTDNMIQSVGSAWASRTPAQVKAALVIAESDVVSLVADLALKSPLASPTFTGTPAAPTQTAKDNSTKIATTAYVDAGQDGWILDSNTWKYGSATQFAVNANATTYMPKGAKVSYNDGAVDYGVVLSVSYLPAAPISASVGSDVSANTITKTAHGLANGSAVMITGLVNTTGITNGVAYWVVGVAANTFQLAATVGGAAIDLTGSNDSGLTITAATVVTLLTTSDYAIANATLTAPRYSYQASPQLFPVWFNWTPTYAGYSANPTITCRYGAQGSVLALVFNTVGTGTSNATGHTMTGCPPPATGSSGGFGPLFFNDGAAQKIGYAYITEGSTVVNLVAIVATGANTASGAGAYHNGYIIYQF